MIDLNKLRELYDRSTQGEWIAADAPKSNGTDAWVYVEPKNPETENDIPIVDAPYYAYYASSEERMKSLAKRQFLNALHDIEFIAVIHNALPELLDIIELCFVLLEVR